MKNRYYLFLFMLLLLFVILSSFNVLYANGSIKFEMIEGDRSKLPKGPSPSNAATYNRTAAETFTVTLTGFEDNAYYEISAVLTRSDFKGYAGNFPTDSGGSYKDLEFLKSDYVQRSTDENGKIVTTYLLGWKWISDTSLSFSIDTTNNAKPGNVVVRCHDWGANGFVTVTIKKKIGDETWEKLKDRIARVPYDENKNGIADKWEKDHNIWVLDETEAKKRASEDKEVAPDATNKYNNDNMESGTTNTAFSTPRAPVAPSAPSSLSARRGTGQVTLSWTAPTSSGSSHIIRYEYRYATGQYPNHSAFTSWTSTGSTSTTYVVTGLTSGTQHLFQVRAVNNDNMESGTTNTAFSTPQ